MQSLILGDISATDLWIFLFQVSYQLFASSTTLGPSHLSKENGPDRHQQLLEQWRFQCNCEEKMAKIRVSFATLTFHSGKLTLEMENPTFSIGNVS